MIRARLSPLMLLVLAACSGPERPQLESPGHFGAPTSLSCVPYAREVSGIDLRGNAYAWWDEAAGVYPRSHKPSPGAVLVFAPHGDMTVGHLAVVEAVRSRREILVTQANWLPHRIEHRQPVVDVSDCNDWSAVRVWYPPAHAFGYTEYPTYGFIEPH